LSLAAFEEAGDPFGRAECRYRLRSLRHETGDDFDHAWPDRDLPVWLAILDDDPGLVDKLVAWVRTPDWQLSAAHLEQHADELLTSAAEAALEHLIDANPAYANLQMHLQLLASCRERGITAGYAQLEAELERERALELLLAWIQTRTWTESARFAQQAQSELFTEPVSDLLDAFATQALRDSDVRAHRGLHALAMRDGLETAYQLQGDRTARLAGLHDGDVTRRLALARLMSGLEHDNAEAHFQLACLALEAGIDDEADAAMADAAENAAPFERRDFIRRLDQLTAVDAAVLGALKRHFFAGAAEG
jgi:hypothetical protein